ncbi:MAG: hypothetical protein NTX64_04125 [Elusimicrobia bacterium]|nr:hypothetical protein [Elusimicrobiota bacterium]
MRLPTVLLMAMVFLVEALLSAPWAAGAASQAKPPAAKAPAAFFSGFGKDSLPTLLDALRSRSRVFRSSVLYLGAYGVDPDLSAALHKEGANWRYAPMLTAVNRKDPSRPERVLTPQDLEKLPESAAAYAGPLPHDLSLSEPTQQIEHALAKLDPDVQMHWGLEMGRRLRDQIRKAAREGAIVDSWQFDEIISEAFSLSASGAVWRRFLAGELHGLAFGRPELGDKPLTGLICIPHPERFATMRGDYSDRLIEEVNRSGRLILGEEYPVFDGDPVRSAQQMHQAVEAALRARGGIAAKLADRYAALMTPGYNVLNPKGQATGYNGNIHNWSDSRVDLWRTRYAQERARAGLAGFGEYYFIGGDARPAVVRGAVDAIAAALYPKKR